MNVQEAIEKADAVRPNTVPDTLKAQWIYELEADLSEMLRIEEPPKNEYPDYDPDLIMPEGHDGIYPLYLMAMIDNANEETALYANDFAVFNRAYVEARQWWVRTHKAPKPIKITGLL